MSLLVLVKTRLTLVQSKGVVCRLGMTGFTLMVCAHVFGESDLSEIDDRCEFLKKTIAFERQIFKECDAEVNACIENLATQHSEPTEQDEEQCWNRPLSLDSRFVGRCPEHMVRVETNRLNSDEAIMDRVYLRSSFQRASTDDFPNPAFKQQESEETMRRILAYDPHNPKVLLVSSYLSYSGKDDVHLLDMFLRVHELDLDCPNNWVMFPGSAYSFTDRILESWLAGEGSGSELSKTEVKSLFLRVQQRLFEAYAFLINDSEGEEKIYWALEATRDSMLYHESENFQQTATILAIEVEDHVKNWGSTLISQFSEEYGVDSIHGRSDALEVMCSSHALEFGLLDHCLKLLRFFSKEDLELLKSPAMDWTRAAISLLNDLTRDCSDYPMVLLHAPSYWNMRQCFEESREEITSSLSELVDRFPAPRPSAEMEILNVYLNLDASSDERFQQAMAMDDSVARFAAPISKRLHRIGMIGPATNILSSVDAEQRAEFSFAEQELYDYTLESIRTGEHQNWMESAVDF